MVATWLILGNWNKLQSATCLHQSKHTILFMTLTHILFLSDGIYLVFIHNPKFSDVQAVRSLVHQQALQPPPLLTGLCLPVQGLV